MYGLRGPCKDCPFRTIGCHAKCERYKTFKRLHEIRSREARLEREKDVMLRPKHRRWAE